MSEPVGRNAREAAIWARIRWLLEDTGIRPGASLGEPNTLGVLAGASLAGLAVLSLWRFQHELGPSFVALFAKEGVLEDVTVILALLGAAWCAGAVWHFSRRNALARPSQPVLYTFGALALALFALAMEEINWGQTILGFSTPEAWKEVNLQKETSLHNVLDRDDLESSARVAGVLLTVAVLILAAIRKRSPRSLLGQVAPHPTLVPLSLCVAYASWKQHSEVVELLIPLFFAFYTYRLWVLSRAG
jgi:hypothetical protein